MYKVNFSASRKNKISIVLVVLVSTYDFKVNQPIKRFSHNILMHQVFLKYFMLKFKVQPYDFVIFLYLQQKKKRSILRLSKNFLLTLLPRYFDSPYTYVKFQKKSTSHTHNSYSFLQSFSRSSAMISLVCLQTRVSYVSCLPAKRKMLNAHNCRLDYLYKNIYIYRRLRILGGPRTDLPAFYYCLYTYENAENKRVYERFYYTVCVPNNKSLFFIYVRSSGVRLN